VDTVAAEIRRDLCCYWLKFLQIGSVIELVKKLLHVNILKSRDAMFLAPYDAKDTLSC